MNSLPSHMPGEERPHISPSQLLTYAQCPEHYLFRYVLGIVLPPGAALLQGSSIHSALEYGFKEKLAGNPSKPSTLMDYYANSFDLGTATTVFKPDEKAANLKDRGARAVHLFAHTVYPTIEPAEVEVRHRVTFPNVEYDLEVRLDLTETDDTISDHKVKMRRKVERPSDLADDLQLTSYALGFRDRNGREERRLRHLNIIADDTPDIIPVEITRTQADLDRLMHTFAGIVRGIKAGVYYCAHRSDEWTCRPEWCGYYSLHRELARDGLEAIRAKYGRR